MKVPKSWKEVTLERYYNLLEVIDMKWEDDTEKVVAMVSALTDVPLKDLTDKVDVKVLKQAIIDIGFIGGKKPSYPCGLYLKCGGKRFEVDLKLKDSAASSFISFSELTKNPTEAKNNIHNIMAIFTYEINIFGFRKKRTVQSEKDIAEHLKKHLTMDKAFAYSGFFLTSYNRLLKATQDYLRSEQMKTLKKIRKVQRS